MSVNRALLLDVFLQSSTRNDRRPEDERHLSYDITSFNQLEFTLPPNTGDGLNIRSLGVVSSFVYFYAPFTVELTLGSLLVPNFKKLLILSAPLSGFSVRNPSTDRSVTCNIVYA
jgi:hypothetical protein